MPDGFMYSASEDAVAVTAAADLFVITVAADVPIRIHWLELMQTTDLGDAQEEVLRIGVFYGITAGTAGAALTETPLHPRAPAATAAITGISNTPSTGGTRKAIIGWNIRQAGPIWVATPEARLGIINAANDPVAFRLMAAPADSITVSTNLVYEEL
jgi:hypothetical protein